MAVLPIRTFGDPVLRRRAAEVSGVDEAVRKLMHDMSDTVIEAPGVNNNRGRFACWLLDEPESLADRNAARGAVARVQSQ